MKFLQGVRAVVLAGGLASCVTAPALAVGVTDRPMAMDGTTILPDPTLNKGDLLPASAATAGVAAVSAAADGPLKNCSRRNPCALPTPARDHVLVGAGETAAVQAHPHAHDAEAARSRSLKADMRS